MLKKINIFFSSNPLQIIWLTTLSFGFIVLVFFFTKIEFLPTFDLQSIFTIFVTVTIFSIFCISILALMNILPSLAWYEIFIRNSEELYFFIDKNENLKFFPIFFYFGLPIILTVSSVTILIFKDLISQWYLAIPLTIYIFSLLIFVLLIKFYSYKNPTLRVKNELFKILIANIVSCFCIILPIYFLLLLTAQSKENDSLLGLFIFSIFTISLIFINILNISISKKVSDFNRIIFSLLLGFILLFYTLLAFQKADIITNKTLEIYKIGNFEVEKIVLNKEGCEIFKAYSIQTVTLNDKCTANNGTIISRIGLESYLEFDNKRFPMASNNILSWIPKTNKTSNNK